MKSNISKLFLVNIEVTSAKVHSLLIPLSEPRSAAIYSIFFKNLFEPLSISGSSPSASSFSNFIFLFESFAISEKRSKVIQLTL